MVWHSISVVIVYTYNKYHKLKSIEHKKKAKCCDYIYLYRWQDTLHWTKWIESLKHPSLQWSRQLKADDFYFTKKPNRQRKTNCFMCCNILTYQYLDKRRIKRNNIIVVRWTRTNIVLPIPNRFFIWVCSVPVCKIIIKKNKWDNRLSC